MLTRERDYREEHYNCSVPAARTAGCSAAALSLHFVILSLVKTTIVCYSIYSKLSLFCQVCAWRRLDPESACGEPVESIEWVKPLSPRSLTG